MKEKELYEIDEFLEWMEDRKAFVFNCKCGGTTKTPVVSHFPENKGEILCPECFNKFIDERNKNC